MRVVMLEIVNGEGISERKLHAQVLKTGWLIGTCMVDEAGRQWGGQKKHARKRLPRFLFATRFTLPIRATRRDS